ncbi:hypothetical protein [Streptomyces cadmiisoli]|uniref:hypothetical protein n=1 Tax=Streptomyces cadmiisoli TaxID=2184053 RepID=UPI0036601DA1
MLVSMPKITRRNMFGKGRTIAAAVAAAGALSTLSVSPAAADEAGTAGCWKHYYMQGTQVQIDNCPGNGAKGWTWAWTDWQATRVYFTYEGVSYRDEIMLDRHQTHQASHGQKVTSVQICNYTKISYSPPLWTRECSVTWQV